MTFKGLQKNRFILRRVFPSVCLGFLLSGGLAWGESACPNAAALLSGGKAGEAVSVSQGCMTANPGDPGVWYVHARALTYAKRYDEALALAEKALSAYPDDIDWRILKVRILAWKGELDRAWQELEKLPVRALFDNDNLRLSADIAYWRSDCDNAIWRYSELLNQVPGDPTALKNRGTCYKKKWELEKAEADFKTLCKLPGEAGGTCMPLNWLKSDTSRFKLLLQPAYAVVVDRPDEWDIYGQVEVRVWKQLRLGASVDWRYRYYNNDALNDTYIEGYISWRMENNFILYASGGGTIYPEFSPTWTAQIEGGYAFKFGLELYLRYSRFEYLDGGANVISPTLIYYIGPFSILGRYYLSIDDTNRVTSAALGKFTYFWGDKMAFYAGVAGGDHADYLDVRGFNTQNFWLVMAGLWWNVTWQHRIYLTYTFRDETAGGEKYLQNYIITGYQFQF